MATYTKETALYDTGAISDGITTAGETASKYISSDNTGIMIYDGENGVQTPSNPSSTTNNVFIDSDSLDIRRGTDALATFGADGAVIGKSTEAHTTIDEDGMQIYSIDSNDTLIELANIGYGEGQSESGTTKKAPYFTFGRRRINSSIGNYSLAEGNYIEASGTYSHAEGSHTKASGFASHAEGNHTTASKSDSHAEGNESTASGSSSHAEGDHVTASGICAHAEGNYTTASDASSHAEGFHTTASGYYSHAQNSYTIATRKSQTAIGEYNIADISGTNGMKRGMYSLIIGNGTATNARSNALTVDWSGNVDIASGAKYKINGSDLSASDISGFATVATSGNYSDLSNKPTIPTVPTNVSAFTNDAGYLTSYTETDPTVPSWAKASSKPNYTASEVGAVDMTIPMLMLDTTATSGTDKEIYDALVTLGWDSDVIV